MKLTNELKARFFAQYWGQEVLIDVNNAADKCHYRIDRSNMYRIEESHLELKPLSSITYEDAIEVSKHIFKSSVVGDLRVLVLNRFNHFTMIFDNAILVYQYLQSKGYALPFMGISVEEMVKAGWIKLKDEQ